MTRRTAVGFAPIINIEGDEYLLVGEDRVNGYWVPPSGGLHKNETLYNGAVRETLEELCEMIKPDDTVKYSKIELFAGKHSFCVLFIGRLPVEFQLTDFSQQQKTFYNRSNFQDYNEFRRLDLIKLDQPINKIDDDYQNLYTTRIGVKNNFLVKVHKRVAGVMEKYKQHREIFENASTLKMGYEW